MNNSIPLDTNVQSEDMSSEAGTVSISLARASNSIICGEAVTVLNSLPSSCIDLVVTSPPYDDLRCYNGFTLNLHRVGQQLYRVLKPGGLVAMVMQDQTKKGAKTLTTFRTIVDWCTRLDFRLFETVIYQKKHSLPGPNWDRRFRVDHEYIPLFLKGQRPAYFDKRHLAVKCKCAGQTYRPSQRLRDGSFKRSRRPSIIPATKCRGTIWPYANTTTHNKLKKRHPATFSDQIPSDLIACFSPKGGLVLDPFVGSGTTAIAAKKLERRYIGIDVSAEYCRLARERLAAET